MNPFGIVDASETAVYDGKLFYTDMDETDLETVSIRSDLMLTSYINNDNIWILVDITNTYYWEILL